MFGVTNSESTAFNAASSQVTVVPSGDPSPLETEAGCSSLSFKALAAIQGICSSPGLTPSSGAPPLPLQLES